MGDDATTEMTHKVNVRTVRLLGGSPDIRKTNAAILKEMYNIRSSLVHKGHVDNRASKEISGNKVSRAEIVARATAVCAGLIRTIVHRGSIPNWREFDILGS
jgi:hypothetical protein